MQGIQALSDEELLKLASPASQPQDISSLSDEELLAISRAPSGEAKPQERPRDFGTSPIEQMMKVASAAGGAKKGLLDLLSGIGRLGARGVEKVTGEDLEEKVPRYEPSELQQTLGQLFPTSEAVGEFAGGALPTLALPGFGEAGLAGRMAGQAGVGAALGPAYSPEQPTGQAALAGGLLGAGGAGAASLLGQVPRGTSKLIKSIMGGTKTAPEVQSAMESAKRLGVDIPLGETIGSPLMKSTQSSFLSALPFSGMGKQYVQAGEGIDKGVKGVLNELKPESTTKVGSTLKSALQSAERGAETEKRSLYTLRDEAADRASNLGHIVEPSSYRNVSSGAIDNLIRKKTQNPEFFTSKDRSLLNAVSKAKDKKEMSFKDAFGVEKDINQMIKETDPMDKSKMAVLHQLKNSIKDDIYSSANKYGNTDLIDRYEEADKFFQTNILPFREKNISDIIRGNVDTDTIIPTFFKTGQYERPQLLSKLTDHLNPEERGHLAHQYLTKSAREISGESDLNADKILTAYNKIGNQQKTKLFTPDQKQKFDDALRLRKMMGSDLQQMITPKTGEKSGKIGLLTGLGTLTALHPALGAGVVGLGQVARRGVMSDALKNLYLRSLLGAERAPAQLGAASYFGLPAMGEMNR